MKDRQSIGPVSIAHKHKPPYASLGHDCFNGTTAHAYLRRHLVETGSLHHHLGILHQTTAAAGHMCCSDGLESSGHDTQRDIDALSQGSKCNTMG
jgi:hypothetical protein